MSSMGIQIGTACANFFSWVFETYGEDETKKDILVFLSENHGVDIPDKPLACLTEGLEEGGYSFDAGSAVDDWYQALSSEKKAVVDAAKTA